jgi:hypothetical protein
MTFLYRFSTLFILLALIVPLHVGAVDAQLYPTYPSTPPSYSNISASTLMSDARVDFGFSTQVEKSNGYQVISPDGDTFYVDNIEKPKCAFYATYIESNGDAIGQGASLEVFSNVYVEEVNFENC